MRSTHESNFANAIPDQRKTRGNPMNIMTNEEVKQMNQNRGDNYDPELERIYGAAKGFGDVSMMSDWEKVSQGSE